MLKVKTHIFCINFHLILML